MHGRFETCETQKNTVNSEPSPTDEGEEVLAPDTGVLQGSRLVGRAYQG